MARHVELERLPRGRTVVELKFRAPKRRLWLVLEREEVLVCMQHPGFDVDLIVGADSSALYDVYFGRTTLAEAVRSGAVTLEGPSRLTRGFGGWSQLERLRSSAARGAGAQASGRAHDRPRPPGFHRRLRTPRHREEVESGQRSQLNADVPAARLL